MFICDMCIFDTLVQSKHLRIERITSLGHHTPKDDWYNQKDNEWVILLQGQARICFADNSPTLSLNPGDYLNIPAYTKHRVEWTTPNTPTIWLAIHYL